MRSFFLKSCWRGAVVAVGLLGAIAACSEQGGAGGFIRALGNAGNGNGSNADQGRAASAAYAANGDDPLEPITQENLKALTAPLVFDSVTGILTVTLGAGELGMASVRSVDNAVIVNGVQAVDNTVSPAVAASSTTVVSISVVEPVGAPDGGGTLLTTEFIADYTNGFFARGLSGGTGGISIAFAGTEASIFGVKGTTGGDVITFGATGVSVNGDAFPDVTWGGSGTNGGAGTFVVSMGLGDDTWSAGGDTASGARFNNDAPTNPATGYGAGVVVYGGPGNDTFNQGSAATPYETIYGGGQSGDIVDYSTRAHGVNVALGVPGIATPTSGNCAAATDSGLPDAGPGGGCVSDEFDDIKNDVWMVNGGAGDDFLTASPTALVGGSSGSDAGTDAGSTDAGHTDAGDAGHDSGVDSGADAGHTDAGADAGHTDAGADAGGGGSARSLIFTGGAGNDTLTPYGGAYTMNGGIGDDTFVMGLDSDPHGPGTINGGAGTDFVDFSNRTAALRITLDGTTRSGTYSGSAVTEMVILGADIENVHGGAGADVIVGNALDNVINGGLGADTMSGMGGVDTVDYSDRTGPVWAAIDGQPHSGSSATITHGYGTSGHAYGDGTCTITSSTEGDTIATDIQNLTGSKGDDCLFAQPVGTTCTGTVCQNTLIGGPGSDMLFGYDDDDILEGASGIGGIGDAPSDSNYLDCGSGFGNTGHDLGVTPPGYKSSCQF